MPFTTAVSTLTAVKTTKSGTLAMVGNGSDGGGCDGGSGGGEGGGGGCGRGGVGMVGVGVVLAVVGEEQEI